LLLAGCAGSNDGDVLNPAKSDLDGTWEYLVTNAYEATFTDCSGDAVVLDGATLHEGKSLAPICLTAVTFDVTQAGEQFEVPPHPVTCSDGASASVSGSGLIEDPDLGGQWESMSDQGVAAVQLFTGVIVGNTIQLTETRRTFSGGFEGGCDLSPPVTALITVR
jgi:hypothetical protein